MASKKNSRRNELCFAGIGLGITLMVIYCIKKFILQSEDRLPSAGGVFALEVAAFLTLLGSFLLGELIRGYEKVIKGMRKVEIGLDWRDILVVLGALTGSLVVYLGFIYLSGVSASPAGR